MKDVVGEHLQSEELLSDLPGPSHLVPCCLARLCHTKRFQASHRFLDLDPSIDCGVCDNDHVGDGEQRTDGPIPDHSSVGLPLLIRKQQIGMELREISTLYNEMAS